MRGIWTGGFALTLFAIGAANAQDPCGYAFRVTGQQIYRDYCQSCHGPGGRGDGASASQSAIRPADLTEIRMRNKGEFPAERIAEIIRTGGGIANHGNGPMPVWGKIFNRDCGTAYSRRAVVELKSYIEALQR